jgi:hypothetical protein
LLRLHAQTKTIHLGKPQHTWPQPQEIFVRFAKYYQIIQNDFLSKPYQAAQLAQRREDNNMSTHRQYVFGSKSSQDKDKLETFYARYSLP